MNAARNVEGEHRAALAVRVLDQRGVLAGDVAREADAEEAVDHQPPGFFRDPVDLRNDLDAEELLLEQLGDDLGVAAVVARAGEDQNILRALQREAHRQLGRGGAGALHQLGLGDACGALDAPNVFGQVNRTMRGHVLILKERRLHLSAHAQR